MRRLLLKFVGSVPTPVQRWVRRRPALAVPLARLLGKAMPRERPLVVTIREGPNAGMLLAMDQATPRYYWLKGHDEPDVVKVLQDQTRAGMVVADVGAHIGIETMMFSRWVGARGVVLSFEPDPGTSRRLATNCELNHLKNVEIFPVALSGQTGRVQFKADGQVTSRVLGDDSDETGAVWIPCSRLDDILFSRKDPRLDFMKIDVEDHEASVLAGAQRILTELKPAILIEIHSAASLHSCVARLRASGYRVQAVPENPHLAAAIDRDEPAAEADFARGHILATFGN